MSTVVETKTNLENYGLDSYKTDRWDEKGFIEKAKEVLGYSQDDYTELLEACSEASKLATAFDRVVITGRSRSLVRAILEKNGLDPNKIAEFDGDTNAQIYKDEDMDGNPITETNRLEKLKEALYKVGERFDGTTSTCFVDDTSRSGTKALNYLETLSQIDGLKDSAFIVLNTSRLTSESDIRERIEKNGGDPMKFFAPETPGDINKTKAIQMLWNISDIISESSNENGNSDEIVSPELQEILGKVSSTALDNIRDC